MVAFANTRGGQIFIGIDDQGRTIGKPLTNALKAQINSLARNCEPSITLRNIEQVNSVIIITIAESDQKPHSCATGYYRRLDAATQKMNQKELKLLFDAASDKPRFEKQAN